MTFCSLGGSWSPGAESGAAPVPSAGEGQVPGPCPRREDQASPALFIRPPFLLLVRSSSSTHLKPSQTLLVNVEPSLEAELRCHAPRARGFTSAALKNEVYVNHLVSGGSRKALRRFEGHHSRKI